MKENEEPMVIPELTDAEKERVNELMQLRQLKIQHVKNIKMSALLATAVANEIERSMKESNAIAEKISTEIELAVAQKKAMMSHHHLLRDIFSAISSADPADVVGLGTVQGLVPYPLFTGARYWNSGRKPVHLSYKPSTVLQAAPKHVRDGIDAFCARIFSGCPIARCALSYIAQCILAADNSGINEMVLFAVSHRHESLQAMCNFIMDGMTFKEAISAIGSLVEARACASPLTASVDELGTWWLDDKGEELKPMFVLAKRDKRLIVWGKHGTKR